MILFFGTRWLMGWSSHHSMTWRTNQLVLPSICLKIKPKVTTTKKHNKCLLHLNDAKYNKKLVDLKELLIMKNLTESKSKLKIQIAMWKKFTYFEVTQWETFDFEITFSFPIFPNCVNTVETRTTCSKKVKKNNQSTSF